MTPAPSAVFPAPSGALRQRPPAVYSVTTVTAPEALAAHAGEWQALAADAIEPNAFYEPWLFLPALRAFGAGGLRVALVRAHGADGGAQLCGFFPFQCGRLHPWVPLHVLESWRHVYGYLTTPLVRAGHAARVLGAVFDWMASPQGAALWRLGQVSGDGPFARALTEACYHRHRPTFLAEGHARAFLQRGEGSEAYLENVMSRKRLREVRRQGRALEKKGKFERRVLGAGEDVAPWAEDFLRLEQAGWKGREKTAFACLPGHADFFREILRGAQAACRLQMLGMYLDGRPVALKVNFLTPPGSFAFKIAYDEAFHSLSPGVVLEAENVDRFHEMPALRWMDSCAVPGHPMIERLWGERRTIQDLWVATGRSPGDLLVSLMSPARWLKRCFWPSAPAAGATNPEE